MGDYGSAPEYCDLLCRDVKDYAAEARRIRAVILAARPGAGSLLDVGCGTGAHARALNDTGFRVDGIDIEPAFVEIARRRRRDSSADR
ncbi:MAG: methyltransferase domain-containing protein [Gemmatimonadota bacterium]